MHLLYTTGHSLAGAHYLAPLVSWAIVLGALYGLVRLVVDLGRWIARRLEPAPGRDYAAAAPEPDELEPAATGPLWRHQNT